MRAVRVGLDGRAFDSPAGGVRRYVRELTRALLSLDPTLTLVALGGRAASTAPLEHVPEPWHPPTNLGWSAVGIPRAARRARIDVYHAPAYTAPPFGVRNLVVTLHDVSYERRPEFYPHRRDGVRRRFYRASARAARVVITDSEFSRREIVAAYGIVDDRIRVIPLGVAPVFVPAPPDVAPPAGVSQPYVLHVGDLHVRRNLMLVLDSVLALRARGGRLAALRLVLVGVDRGLLPALVRRAKDAGDPGALQVLDGVDDHRLATLYQAAAALVYPSLYEGFGLPLVEAMASGTPVLAARAATAEEVTGDAAWLLPVDDGARWAEAIEAVVTTSGRAAALRERGLVRARQFTWRRTAEATLQVYRECAR